MNLHCDHCRGNLGPHVHRYWQMRFCSPACLAAYRDRLDDGTKAKIERLDFVVAEPSQDRGRGWLGSITRHLPGHFS